MIRVVAIMLLMVPMMCFAQFGKPIFTMPSAPSQQNNSHSEMAKCANLATIYRLSAQYRDSGISPQQSYQALLNWTRNGILDRDLRDIINTVYFDQDFENAGGQRLHNQIFNRCMGTDSTQFNPLN